MKHIRSIILEDEYKPREALKTKLEKYFPEVEVVALCSNAKEAKEQVVMHNPELLFLDIEMQGESGIELLQQLRQSGSRVHVIVTTAYNKSEYYRKAMHLSAVDYLLKPIMKEELAEALERVKEKIAQPPVASDAERLAILYLQHRQIECACVTGKLFLREDHVVFIRAEGNYSRVYMTDGKNQLVTESLKQLEEKLRDSVVFRADRSHFVNYNYVLRVETTTNKCYFLSSIPFPPLELNETGIKNLLKRNSS